MRVKNYKKNSDAVFGGIERVAHRALLMATGLTEDQIRRPLIAIANSWSEVNPGHVHLRRLAKFIKKGIIDLGGTPLEFNTIGICDGIAMMHNGMRYSLPSREVIAASVEIMIRAHGFDAMVMVASCDKAIPGMLMAAMRLDIPAILLNGGPMKAGVFGEKRNLCSGDAYEMAWRYFNKEITKEELKVFEKSVCPAPGSCSHMATANTMALAAEAMGMILSGGSTPLATSKRRLKYAFESGSKIMYLLKRNITPKKIVKKESIENSIRVILSTGGSTNAILHLTAIAKENGISIDLEDFDKLSENTPYLCSLTPSGVYTLSNLERAGGVPAILKALGPLVNKGVMTVDGITIDSHIKKAEIKNRRVIRNIDDLITKDGGIVVLKGNIAECGAVVKKSAVSESMLIFKAKAKVFESEEEAVRYLYTLKEPRKEVVVVRNEGPKGGPGMREMLGVTAALCAKGFDQHMAVVTDGRFSGATKGLAIGHICPEAAEKGAIGIIKNGDMIKIDIRNKSINLEVEESIIRERLKNYRPKMRIRRGFLSVYKRNVQKTSEGATLCSL
ncbi:MAG: dihydroxy-acid dehydratase [bacterium]